MVARKIVDSGIFSKPPTWFKIFIFLLIEASHKDRGNLKRGQCFMTYKTICLSCKVTKSVVDHGIHWMKKQGMLATHKVIGGMIVTIPKYDTYQDPEYYKGDGDGETKGIDTPETGDAGGIQKGQHITSIEALSINKNETTTGGAVQGKKKKIASFDIFWEAYPNKVDKKDSLTWWKQNKPDEALLQRMLVAIEQKKRSEAWTKEGGKFILSPWRWLKRAKWEDAAKTTPNGPKPQPTLFAEGESPQERAIEYEHSHRPAAAAAEGSTG